MVKTEALQWSSQSPDMNPIDITQREDRSIHTEQTSHKHGYKGHSLRFLVKHFCISAKAKKMEKKNSNESNVRFVKLFVGNNCEIDDKTQANDINRLHIRGAKLLCKKWLCFIWAC